MSTRVCKRKLEFTPSPGGRYRGKEKKAREDEIERRIHEARGMEPPLQGAANAAKEFLDSDDIFQTVLSRYNQEAKRTGQSEGSEGVGKGSGMIEPLLQAMTTCMIEVMGRFMSKFIEGEARRREEDGVVEKECVNSRLLLAKYENDRLEQYTRRENIRVAGISEEQGETPEGLEAKIVGVCKDVGVNITPDAFAAVHRVGKKGDKPRQVMVRFVSRRVRDTVVGRKKVLKEQDKGVFINDDLTLLRSKMMYAIKQTKKWIVWSVRGVLHCTKKLPEGVRPEEGRRQELVIVETPDDLIKVGITSIDLADLGLQNVILPELPALH